MSSNDNQLIMLDWIIKHYGNDDVDERKEHTGKEEKRINYMLIHETNDDAHSDCEKSNGTKEKKPRTNNSTAFKKLYY